MINGVTTDKGQRYEVRCYWGGTRIVFGYTNDPTASKMLAVMKGYDGLTEPTIHDRTPGLEKLVQTPFKSGCRKCLDAVYGGKEACPYCNLRFVRPVNGR